MTELLVHDPETMGDMRTLPDGWAVVIHDVFPPVDFEGGEA